MATEVCAGGYMGAGEISRVELAGVPKRPLLPGYVLCSGHLNAFGRYNIRVKLTM